MCLTCGCGDEENVRVATMGTTGHSHAHAHEHEHVRASAETERLELGELVLAKNDHLAGHNRAWLGDRRIRAVNVMSSPGSGKTSLLERTIAENLARWPVAVIEGDQETRADAERIAAAGARAVQVNTGSGCHLDAQMVGRALESLQPEDDSLLFIENVGNLVCPALFDIGEIAKVVVISVTEGDDKPLKYPHMFAAADLVVVNKTDLLPYVDFDVQRLAKDADRLNPGVTVMPLSVRSGENLPAWYAWLDSLVAREEGAPRAAATTVRP